MHKQIWEKMEDRFPLFFPLENFRLGKSTVDWYKETFKKNSIETQHNFSINEGTEAIQYFTSVDLNQNNATFWTDTIYHFNIILKNVK